MRSPESGDTTGFLVTVSRQGDFIIAAVSNIEAVPLKPVSETEFIHGDADFSLDFIFDDSDRVAGCRLNLGPASVAGQKIE